MKILLVTDIPPCRNYTAGLVLDMLCRFLPAESIACCAIMNKEINDAILPPDLAKKMPFKRIDKPQEFWPKPIDFKSHFVSFLGEMKNEQYIKNYMLDEIAGFASRFGVDKIWFVIQGQTEIYLARSLARMLGKPFVVQIWDPLYFWMDTHNVDKFTQKKLMREFACILRDSDGFFAASWNMAEDYSRRYSVRSIPFVACLEKELAVKPVTAVGNSDTIRIAGNGKVYPVEMWTSLCEALDLVDWKICGKKVILRVMSNNINPIKKWEFHIENPGWLSQEETVKKLSECDIMYCPYWLDPYYAEVARMSFPGKMATFAAAGRPILFHGPKDASPAKFLSDNEAGLICNSYEPDHIIDAITTIIRDKVLYSKLARNAGKVFEKFLTKDSLKKNFAEFLRNDIRALNQ